MTSAIDVNQQMFTSRTAAWDRREYLGRDGLDTTLGQAALYTTTPAWHGLGTVIPGGLTDIDKVLDLAGINFDVELRKVRYAVDGDLRTFDGQFVTTRTDTHGPLGVVGGSYTPVQNRQAFEFLEELVAQNDITWESAGALRGGRRVFVSMRLPGTVTVDAEGINDQIIPFIAALNSHDGNSPFQVVVTPWRPICANTERFAVRDAFTRWTVRHTANAVQRINEARRTLKLSLQYYDRFAEEETQLARTDLSIAEFDKVIAELWPVEQDATTRVRNRAQARRDRLHHLFAEAPTTAGARGTAYAAERAITDYLDHIAPKRPGKTLTEELARATALMTGADDEIKSRAHQRLMLVRR